MTDRETAENIAKNIDTMAEEIAKRSIPSSDESFREWSSHRLHEPIKTHANSIILDYLSGDFQTLAALGAASEMMSRANLRPCLSYGRVEIAPELRPPLKRHRAACPAHRDRS
jgi:hypothetical protein